jgi:hypothetical protein
MFHMPSAKLTIEERRRMAYLTWRASYLHRVITDLLAERISSARMQDGAQDNTTEETGPLRQEIGKAPASRDPATIIEVHLREWLDIGREMNEIRDAACICSPLSGSALDQS